MTYQSHAVGRSFVDHEQQHNGTLFASSAQLSLPLPGSRRPVLPEPVPMTSLERLLIPGLTMDEWLQSFQEIAGSQFSQLHWDILRFCKAAELSPAQKQMRKLALDHVVGAVHELWPTAQVHLFGSTATGLALPWSDIDVSVMSPSPPTTNVNGAGGVVWQKPSTKALMSALGTNLRRRGQCQSLQQIPHAKVPLLKLRLRSGVACDISFDVFNGPRGVPVIRQFLEEYEASRSLCLALKLFLGQLHLNELYTGGLGSFCLINMIVGHLQKVGSNPVGRDLGALLLSFFVQYSTIHNYATDVVSTRNHFSGSKASKGWMNIRNPELLAVEDPMDPHSDIGKGTYRISEIRQEFARAVKVLLSHWHQENVLGRLVDLTTDISQRPKRQLHESNISRPPKRNKKNWIRSSGTGGEQDGASATHPPQRVQHEFPHRQATGLVVTTPDVQRILHDYGEVPLNPALSLSTKGSMQKHSVGGTGGQSIPKVHPEGLEPEGNARGARGRSEDEQLLSTFWETLSSRRHPKKAQLKHNGIGIGIGGKEEPAQPVQEIHLKSSHHSPEQGSGVVTIIEVERIPPDNNKNAFVTPLSRQGSLQHNETHDTQAAHAIQKTHVIHPRQVTDKVGENEDENAHAILKTHVIHPRQVSDKAGKNEDEKVLLSNFWEAYLNPTLKSRRGSLKPHVTRDAEQDAEPRNEGILVQSEQPEQGSGTVTAIEKESTLSDIGDLPPNPIPSPEQPKRSSGTATSIEKESTLSDIGDLPPNPILSPEQSERGSGTVKGSIVSDIGNLPPNPTLSQEGNLRHNAQDEDQGANALPETIPTHPYEVDLVDQSQTERTLLSQFWESHINPKFRSKKSSLNLDHMTGRGEDGAQAVSQYSEQGKDLVGGRTEDERIIGNFWEVHLAKSRKPPLLEQTSGDGGEEIQPVESKLPEHQEELNQNERILSDFWEACLNPRLKSRKGNFRHVDGGETYETYAKPPLLTIRTQEDKDLAEDQQNERILSEFWEVNLNPRLKPALKSRKRSLAQLYEAGNIPT